MTISGRISANASLSGAIGTGGSFSGEVNRATTIYVDSLVFGSHIEFPNVGDPTKLYIATDEAATYFYNANDNTYVCCGNDCGEIDRIISGLNEEE